MQAIGIFGLGEMGAGFARLLTGQGVEVVSYVEERSEATRRRAAEAGVLCLSSVCHVVERSEVILSITISSAAIQIARQVAEELGRVQTKPLFADCNAISPGLAREIDAIIGRAGGRFVDASIIGLARNLGKGTVLYVSGAEAGALTGLRSYGLDVDLVGPRVGQASGLKMLYAGLTKGISALTTELLLTAERLGITERVMQTYNSEHPELARLIARLIPSLPFRAARRSLEMEELERTMRSAGLEPHTPKATAAVLRWIGDMHLERSYSGDDEGSGAESSVFMNFGD